MQHLEVGSAWIVYAQTLWGEKKLWLHRREDNRWLLSAELNACGGLIYWASDGQDTVSWMHSKQLEKARKEFSLRATHIDKSSFFDGVNVIINEESLDHPLTLQFEGVTWSRIGHSSECDCCGLAEFSCAQLVTTYAREEFSDTPLVVRAK